MDEEPLPSLTPGLIDPASMAGEEATKKAVAALERFNSALESRDAGSLANCFYTSQAYWKDIVALTYHLRTFKTPDIIAAALIETNAPKTIENGIQIDGAVTFFPVTPVLVRKKYTRVIWSQLKG